MNQVKAYAFLFFLVCCFIVLLGFAFQAVEDKIYAAQEGEEAPPHVTDPVNCKTFCYPKGGPSSRPKGVPETAHGVECAGTHCGHVNHEDEGEIKCDEGGGCSTWCSKPCCTCLAVCM